MVERILIREGHTIFQAEDGVECIKMVSQAEAEAEATRSNVSGDGREGKGGVNVANNSSDGANNGTRSSVTAVYDVILMDDNMPNMTGPEAAELLRSRHNYRGLIVGITGNTAASDIQHFLDAGADSVLSKPLELGKLKAIVNKHFSSAAAAAPAPAVTVIVAVAANVVV
jgi:CheY-like chemotaxis protein